MDAKDRPLCDITVQINFFLLHNYEPVTKLQSTTQKGLISEHAQTCSYNESLRIL